MVLCADKIAVIGDLHGKWNECDNQYFEASGHDLLIFLGDLGSGSTWSERRIIRLLADLRVPSLILPGNNDAEFLDELSEGLLRSRVVPCDDGLSEICGYSSHVVRATRGEVTIIFGRPFAMGGSEFSFGRQLESGYGITALEHSAGRLKRLVEDAPTSSVIFIAHNGPYGLGGASDALWSRDFRLPDEIEETAPRDWGDSDLAEAVSHAHECGKDVLAVIAGHMHRTPRGCARPFSTVRGGTSYVNAAMVPRIFDAPEGRRHHMVEVSLFPQSDVVAGASSATLESSPAVCITEIWRQIASLPHAASGDGESEQSSSTRITALPSLKRVAGDSC